MKKRLTTFAAAIGLAATTFAATIDLSTVTADRIFSNGDVIYGTLGSNVQLSIDYEATVTLSNAVINGVSDSNYKWAGLTCCGNATIILVGESTVNGFYADHPGIYVPEGYTLTIKGSGSLNAGGHNCGAGIGGAFNANCGNIVIESGTITATGGIRAAGIGSGQYGKCSGITISGGTVTATGNKAAGIGSGSQGVCGNITISGGTVTATGDDVGIGSAWYGFCGSIDISGGTVEANCNVFGGNGIGTGQNGSCGIIVIDGGVVTATAGGDITSAIGSGDEGSCGRIYIGSGITRIVATCSGNYWDNPISIGASKYGTCGAVVVDDSLDDTTIVSTRTITSKVVNLANVTEDTTVADGKIITGTLGGNYKVSIADGATVTLRDVNINGVNNSSYKWAGITCEGDATIILEGANTVKGFYENYPGIYVPESETLTIKGSGSLNARSNGYGAGIGAAYAQTGSCGSIIIEGGSIVAVGGSMGAAGIGSCYGSSCDDITITGGVVESTGGKAAAGIGCGAEGRCGDITIAKTVERVTATGGAADYGYGAGKSIGLDGSTSGTCGTVTIGGVVTGSIAESPYTYPENIVDLSGLSGAYTAQDGDTLRGTTAYAVTIPGGATVTVNGVDITGAAGGTVLPAPAFSADGKAATTEFVQGANGKWTLTAFAELGNDALGKDVTAGQIKVYRADTVAGLDSASPMTSGVEVKGKKSAVMTTIEVTPPTAPAQFFRVKFGE